MLQVCLNVRSNLLRLNYGRVYLLQCNCGGEQTDATYVVQLTAGIMQLVDIKRCIVKPEKMDDKETLYMPENNIKIDVDNSTFCPHTVFMSFVWISEQTAIISLYNIN